MRPISVTEAIAAAAYLLSFLLLAGLIVYLSLGGDL